MTTNELFWILSLPFSDLNVYPHESSVPKENRFLLWSGTYLTSLRILSTPLCILSLMVPIPVTLHDMLFPKRTNLSTSVKLSNQDLERNVWKEHPESRISSLQEFWSVRARTSADSSLLISRVFSFSYQDNPSCNVLLYGSEIICIWFCFWIDIVRSLPYNMSSCRFSYELGR